MTPQDVRSAITPLRLIFWGGLLCIFDLTVSQTSNGEGFKFDFLNDAVGAAMIAVGVYRLVEISVHDRYVFVMRFVSVVSIVAVLDAIRDHFVFQMPSFVHFVLLVFSLVCLIAIICFCVAMRWFCEQAGLKVAALSWRTTTRLFVAIYLIPLGLFYLAACGAILTGTSFHFDIGAGAILALAVFAVPLVHLFISTSRMARAAGSQSDDCPFDHEPLNVDEPPRS